MNTKFCTLLLLAVIALFGFAPAASARIPYLGWCCSPAEIQGQPLGAGCNDTCFVQASSLICREVHLSMSAELLTEADDLVLVDGGRLSGTLTGANITVPFGATVIVEGDMVIGATGVVQVDGVIVIRDSQTTSSPHAPNLRIHSAARITVNGVIRGGRGADFGQVATTASLGMPGGNGSSITLEAPDIHVRGVIEAGDGGQGGGAAKGGDGGWIHQIGRHVTDKHSILALESGTELPAVRWRAGDGGRGGDSPFPTYPGGDGGAGGGLTFANHTNEPEWEFRETTLAGSSGWRTVQPKGNLVDCQNGADGDQNPGDAVGGVAGDGGHGADGTASSPNGSNGGSGGSAPSITGPVGQDGQKGEDCCNEPQPGPGGKGGKGGAAPKAVGKKGGNGGNGGNAYRLDVGSPWLGNGGKAGDAGNGASATTGKGGKGGNGGKGVPGGAGGNPGPAGTPTPGAAGTPGTPGQGLTGGGQGAAASSGNSVTGGPGNWGDPGPKC